MVESDRARFVEMFTDPGYMVFFGVQSVKAAHCYVDHLLELNVHVPFAKQPIIVRDSGAIVGYAGVDWFELDGRQELEFGYRLVHGARGVGYETEASLALLDVARASFDGTIYALIHEANAASISTIGKLGFDYWKQGPIDGALRNIYRWRSETFPSRVSRHGS